MNYDMPNQFVLCVKVRLAHYFYQLNHFDKTYALILPVYENKELLDFDNDILMMYYCIYKCKQNGYFEEINIDQIINSVDEIQNFDKNHLIFVILEFQICIFEDELKNQDAEILKIRLSKILDLIEDIYNMIDQNSIQKSLPIFNWIELILKNNTVKNNNWILQEIYNSLKVFSKVELNSEQEEFDKNFYLVLLAFKIQNKHPQESNERFWNLQQFVNLYIKNTKMQTLLFDKLIQINLQLIEDGQTAECLKNIEILNSIISKQKKSNQFRIFIEKLQNQRDKISKLKNKK